MSTTQRAMAAVLVAVAIEAFGSALVAAQYVGAFVR